MLRHVVVPLDGSGFGEHALPLAIEIAERHRAEVELVSVYEALAPYQVQNAPPLDPAFDEEQRHERRTFLDNIADRLRRSSSVKIECRVLDGADVLATLADYLASSRPDLVILAAHSRRELDPRRLGSVAAGLIRRAGVPTLLVRANDAAVPDDVPHPLRKILVPLDLTPADEEVLDDVVAVAAPGETECFLLHVREPVAFFEQDALTPNDVPEYDADTAKIEPYAESHLAAAADDYLQEIAGRIRHRGVAATPQVVVDESPAKAILEFADAWGMDLIVLAPHERTGLSRLLSGGVADKVIRGTRIPVLIDRHPEDAARPSVSDRV